jgi:hypothetical protein
VIIASYVVLYVGHGVPTFRHFSHIVLDKALGLGWAERTLVLFDPEHSVCLLKADKSVL